MPRGHSPGPVLQTFPHRNQCCGWTGLCGSYYDRKVHFSNNPVDEKLINSRSKKEMEIFIQANLRIITWETVFQKALSFVLPIRGQSSVTYFFLETNGYASFDSLQINTYKMSSGSWVMGHSGPLRG